MNSFTPDFCNIVEAAKNQSPKRIPLYEHLVDDAFMVRYLEKPIEELMNGNQSDLDEGMRRYCEFFLKLGFDTVSFERCITSILPGAGALYSHAPGSIHNMEDYQKYPWDTIADIFFITFSHYYESLARVMPDGMKVIGGVGNGAFECVQDLVGYTNLCYIKYDDPELYGKLFKSVGNIMVEIWDRLLNRFGDIICVGRFGDDLGFKSTTLIPAEDIRKHVIPAYQKTISRIHQSGKPFILHSCGNIFEVMDDLIDVAKIDGKHSNEDAIAPFKTWAEIYGDKIANFGGVDCDILTRETPEEIKKIVTEIYNQVKSYDGIALGTGNSVPIYIAEENYLAMNEAIRIARGE
ncbi:MAG: hypothetical protein KAQ68_00675 [Clostridiales bacterium]|nr:hypothetical protein [Clostridiales bacterium]